MIASLPVRARTAILGILIALLALASGQVVAFAVLGVRTSNSGNQAALTTLAPPTNVATTHDGNHTTNPQQVVLTWTATSSGFASGYLVQRAVDQAGACGSFATIATVTPATTTTFIDGAATYNQQFCYRVLTYFSNWTAPSVPSNVALSLPATSATDTSGNGTIFYAVARRGASGSGWAVGSGGTITTTTTGSTWTQQTSSTTQDLMAVFAIDANTVVAVGRQGTIVTTTNGGATWTKQTTGTTQDLFGVAAADAGHIWAVGAGGTILFSSNGTSWGAQSAGTSSNLFAVSAISKGGTNAAWAVGAAGVILQTCDGATPTWTAETSGTTSDLLATYFTDTTTGWAVGKSGTIIVTSNAACPASATWRSQVSGTSNDLHGVGASSNDLCAVGPLATMVNNSGNNSTTGFAWSAGTPPAGFIYDLHGTSGQDGCKFFAVGEAGQILHIESGNQNCSGSSWSPGSVALTTGGSYSLPGSDLSRLANSGDAPRYESRDSWPSSMPSGCSGKYVMFQMSPAFLDSAPISTALATLTYQAATNGGTMTARLLVSGDGGATYTVLPLNAPTTSLQTQTVDIHSVINSAATLTNMRLCFQAVGSIPYPMLFDLVHVDVN